MSASANTGAVCRECALAAGFIPKNKTVGVWMDKCVMCGESKPCTDLVHDWMRPKKENAKMRKPKTDPRTVIRCGSEDDAKLAYMAMFRYAFGRMTYMPDVVIGIIKANADTLTKETLELLDRDLTDEADRYERAYRGKRTIASNYGMKCDRETWLAFHEWVKGALARQEGNA